ncbi:hypothetical protein [Mycobacterium mantenii]|uniref:Uncharacterized protein n=1 Tax=Mycobacterium mantenii TaxID=560555 RepID=A0A1A2TQX4_MYCNT|nr:hypothetical protein [Mycobacterium mantenii]OBH46091.1 hypothetical protein A5688_05785 [Mycobacterium mantenii]OBH53173.1 hypothetical protein A5687_07455 [Mycobacterium mantenii]OBH78791.1 hypothetical protein A5683_16570 [Mycobacterium mantenii]OBH79408.1 hypothetical protein A5682_17110 [Mycobacterium mantenii]
MNFSPRVDTATRMFSRVLGPYNAIVCVTGLLRRRSELPLLSDIGIWPWATAAPLLMIGLVIIALHPHWRSAAAVIVSVLGWLMALRGFALLAFPGLFSSIVGSVTNVGAHRTIYAVLGVIGLYLTYVGWAPAAGQSELHELSSTRDEHVSRD